MSTTTIENYEPVSSTELISRFGQAVSTGSASIFVGAGMSISAGYPNWETLLKFARRDLGLPSSFEDLSLLAQYYIASVPGGRDRFEETIIANLRKIVASPGETHGLLSEIPVTEYWTTNYDTLLERAIVNPLVLTEDIDLVEYNHHAERRVYKIHGTIPSKTVGRFLHSTANNSGRFVIAREDFEQYPQTHPRMWAQLVATFLTKSLLFLGFSFTDPNILHLFMLARKKVGLGNREHFTLMKRPTSPSKIKLFKLRSKDLADSGIRVCEVSDYDEAQEILKSIVRRTRDPKIFIAGSLSDPIRDQDRRLLELIGSLCGNTEASFVTSGPAGRILCYSFATALVAGGKYDPSRLTLYYQSGVNPAENIEKRLGVIHFFGENKSEMRSRELSHVRALLIVGGNSGTEEEIKMAREQGLPIIPLPNTGGVAEKEWDSMRASLTDYSYGGSNIASNKFDLLRHSDINIVAQQAIEFFKKAVYLED